MDNQEVQDVRVVATETDRAELIKNAAIQSVVAVLVTGATTWAMTSLANRAAARQARKAVESNLKPNTPQE